MFNIEKAHYIIDEMIMSGYIVETNRNIILGYKIFIKPHYMKQTNQNDILFYYIYDKS